MRLVEEPIDYLDPRLPAGLPRVPMPVVEATPSSQRFLDKQSAVHARVSVDFPREFGCLLEAPTTSATWPWPI